MIVRFIPTDNDPPEPYFSAETENVVMSVWPAGKGTWEVSCRCYSKKARWWKRWMSGLPHPLNLTKELKELIRQGYAWTKEDGSKGKKLTAVYAEVVVTYYYESD